MSRIALSEFRAKHLVFSALGLEYSGISVDLQQNDYAKHLRQVVPSAMYVVKVDQAVKKRNKQGLVRVKRTQKQVLHDLADFKNKGFRYALIEPFVPHAEVDEQFVALSRTTQGIQLSFSHKGGVGVEDDAELVQHALLSENGFIPKQNTTALDNKLVASLFEVFLKAHMTLLEINPLVVSEAIYVPLDAAIEVDSAAEFFVAGFWKSSDMRTPNIRVTPYELTVEQLNAKSPASLNLKVLNPDGAFFLLLSGGGASVVVADELGRHLKEHRDMANYGEYSGNPNEEETYLYASEILRLLIDSKAPKKILLIAGGVANFTDVAQTFAGIIRAMQDSVEKLKTQNLQVIVRRGGPNQRKGLAAIKNFLDKAKIPNQVYGPDVSLPKTVAFAVERVK